MRTGAWIPIVVFSVLILAGIALSAWQIHNMNVHSSEYSQETLLKMAKQSEIWRCVWALLCMVTFIMYCLSNGRPFA